MGGRLLELVPARRGHFAFGADHGDLWLDLDALVARPGALRPYAEQLADFVAPYRPEVVCGPLTGGAYVAQLVALALDAEFTWSTPGTVARAAALAGRRVAVVDDAVNAGSAASATAAALRAAGATVPVVAALLLLGAAPARVGDAPVVGLTTVPSMLRPAADCPLCAAGTPLT